jgi:hypothetical protein
VDDAALEALDLAGGLGRLLADRETQDAGVGALGQVLGEHRAADEQRLRAGQRVERATLEPLGRAGPAREPAGVGDRPAQRPGHPAAHGPRVGQRPGDRVRAGLRGEPHGAALERLGRAHAAGAGPLRRGRVAEVAGLRTHPGPRRPHRAAHRLRAGGRRVEDRAALEELERPAPVAGRHLRARRVAEDTGVGALGAPGRADRAADRVRPRRRRVEDRTALEGLQGADAVGGRPLVTGRVAERAGVGARRGPGRPDAAADRPGAGARGPEDRAALEVLHATGAVRRRHLLPDRVAEHAVLVAA